MCYHGSDTSLARCTVADSNSQFKTGSDSIYAVTTTHFYTSDAAVNNDAFQDMQSVAVSKENSNATANGKYIVIQVTATQSFNNGGSHAKTYWHGVLEWPGTSFAFARPESTAVDCQSVGLTITQNSNALPTAEYLQPLAVSQFFVQQLDLPVDVTCSGSASECSSCFLMQSYEMSSSVSAQVGADAYTLP